MSPRSTTIRIRHHGRTIIGDLAYPLGRRGRVPAVLMVHGYTGNRRGLFFSQLMQSLVTQGYAVLTIDFNGHGGSDGPFRKFTYTRCIEDVTAAVKFLQAQPRINPHKIGALGHSMGATAVMLARARGVDIHALALLAPVGDLKTHDRATYTPAYVKRWKRRGYIVVKRKHLPEPLHLGYDYWLDRRRIDTLAEARNVHQPVLIVHGTKDRMVPLAESRQLITRFDGPASLVVVRGSRHGFAKPQYYRALDRAVKKLFARTIGRNVRRAVVAFVRRGDRYLIMQRSNRVGHYRGYWAIVGGHLEDGMDPRRQIVSELREETGFPRRAVRFVKQGSRVVLYDRELDVTWSVVPFLFETRRTTPRLDWEHTTFRWVTAQRLPLSRMYPGFRAQCESIGIL